MNRLTPFLLTSAFALSLAVFLAPAQQPAAQPATQPATQPPSQTAAAPLAAGPDAALTSLINELATQQKQIADNMTQMETRLATIEEDVRQARIFARRGGGGGTN